MRIMLFFLMLSTIAHGNGVERGRMSPELQARIIAAVYRNCNIRDAFSVNVIDVTVQSKATDLGFNDYLYEVNVLAEFPAKNEEIIKRAVIRVKAGEFNITHPDMERAEILSVRAKNLVCE